jgi:hypothetical protein
MITVKQLACLLLSYDCDTPHWAVDDSQYYPVVTEEMFNQWLADEHFGDCIGEPNICERCFAEDKLHQAQWLHKYIIQY